MRTQDHEDRAERLQQAIRLKKARADSRQPDLRPRPANEAAHLGEMQRSLWLVHRMDPHSPAYNLTSAFRVLGSLKVTKLQSALDQVVSRHRILRSTFYVERDSVLQIVHPDLSITVEVVETSAGGGRAASVAEARRPFDLATGPLLRMRLIEEANGGEHLLLLVLHHILADERSLGLLWKELAAAYEDRPLGSESAIQYDDYVYWQRQRVEEPGDEDLDYWRQKLKPLPDELRLPFEKSVSEKSSVPGKLLNRSLGPAAKQNIRGLAADAGASPFMVSAFAFRLLLQRYSLGQRIAFATPVSTRSHPATVEMIGYFLNPLVISASIDEDQSVLQAIADFSRELRDCLAHASVSFQRLAEVLSPPRQRDRHPIFQVMFVYQETTPPSPLGEARLEPLTLDLGVSKFDLTLFLTEGEAGLEIAVEYRTDRFAEVWMHNLLGHYTTLLEHLPENLRRATAEVPMLGERERSWLTAHAQGPGPEPTAGDLLPEQILKQADGSPRSIAVTSGGSPQSYAALAGSARSIVRRLRDAGVQCGDRVGLFLDRSPLMIAGILGSHWAGTAYVPVDPSYPQARNRLILEDAEIAAVLTTSTLRSRLPQGPWTTIDTDDLEDEHPSLDVAGIAATAPAYILYTSGSTGRPKGVVVSHGNLKASTEARLQAYDFSPGRFLLLPSIAFDSSVAGIFWTLATAGSLVIPTEEEITEPRRLARLVVEEQINGLLCVPSLYAQLLQAGGSQLQGLEFAIVAGESCSPRLVEEHFRLLPEVRLINEYGPTEATVWASVYELTQSDAKRRVAIGSPIPGARVEVLDSRGRQVPAGIPGTAWVAGPTVAQGYWRRPDLTAEHFDGEPGTVDRRYCTGDRMARREDGELLFLGREDEQIKLRGYRIEPGEIEAALLGFSEVDRVAVVARAVGVADWAADDNESLALVAFFEGPGVPAAWRQTLARHLPDHMIPNRLVRLPELPLLPNSKIDRQRLRQVALEPEVQAETASSVPTTLEQALISLWEGLLERSGIGSNDNFIELGGHSLSVVEMTLAIERDFGVSLSAADVFENPTVAGLARRIGQQEGAAATYQHLFPIHPGGRKMPFIVAVPHFFTAMFAARFRGERPVYGLRGVGLRPEGNLGRWRTMTDLGKDLVREIQQRFPDERCIMAGYSFGASMAIEAVRLMEEQGIPVHRLYLIAPMPVDIYRLGPAGLQIDGLKKPVDELSTSEALRLYARANNPFTRRPYQRAWRRLAIEPWRRLLCLVGRLRRLAGRPLTPRLLYADVRVDRFRLHARYRPGVVHTPTVIFNAKEPETDAAATWRPYFDGPFTVHEIPDPHLDDTSIEAARQVILGHLKDLEDR